MEKDIVVMGYGAGEKVDNYFMKQLRDFDEIVNSTMRIKSISIDTLEEIGDIEKRIDRLIRTKEFEIYNAQNVLNSLNVLKQEVSRVKKQVKG